MMVNQIKRFLLLVIMVFYSNNPIFAQEYLWPTDASHYLTSSFAEYRPGHFHAGIDIKTWGREGYKVIAVRDGYISRIRVSPFGYGKAIYQRLDTGEIAVYAHLSRFNNKLEKFVKQEQQKRGAYSFSKYLKPDQFPVKKGEVIAYTGSSGIGYPHLHFELRDANNRPFNPFLNGFRIKDTIPPTINEISITPLNASSRVNGDVVPLILRPDQSKVGYFQIKDMPLLSGNIGFAVKCQDRANGVNNRFAVHKLKFYVDNKFLYSAIYNKFSYGKTHLINFDRDFRLRKRGKGLFQNLYKIRFNNLPFYKPQGEEVGILHCDPELTDSVNMKNIFGKGKHWYRGEISDFWGNTAIIEGGFLVGEKIKLSASFYNQSEHILRIRHLKKQNGELAHKPQFYLSKDRGNTWINVTNSGDSVTVSSPYSYDYMINGFDSTSILKIQTKEDLGAPSFPLFYFGKNVNSNSLSPIKIELIKDFYDDYVRFLILAKNGFINNPEFIIYQNNVPVQEVELVQCGINQFTGIYRLEPFMKGDLRIKILAWEPDGNPVTMIDEFELQPVTPVDGGSIVSNDGRCRVEFTASQVYKNLYLRMETADSLTDEKYESIGCVYMVHPEDVLLKGRALIEIEYPESDTLPEKLGIYRKAGNGWRFVGNRLDEVNYKIRAKVSHLNTYTLIRDVTPPVIEILQPRKNAKIAKRKPVFRARVFDELSGIRSEKSISMVLDGRKLIAEYDPEKKTIAYWCDTPLSFGRHQITMRASDRCENETIVNQFFYIVQ